MNAIDLLKQDHKTVQDHYSQYQAADAGASKQKTELAGEICSLVETHSKLEPSGGINNFWPSEAPLTPPFRFEI